MEVLLFAFGKLKTAGLADAAEHYRKCLSGQARLREIELKSAPVPDKSDSTRRKIQAQETRLLLERAQTEGLSARQLFVLDETGHAFSSLQWAGWIHKQEPVGRIGIAVGSSLGFSSELKKQCAGLLSLGPQTLPHELARVVLLEQIYRAFSILKRHPYHNEG